MGITKSGCCVLLGAMVLPTLAFASSTPPQQASMVVSGIITVNPQGGVATYTLHDPGRLPAAVVQLIKQTVSDWRFKPVLDHGAPVTASTGMSLRVVADIADPEHATIQIDGASFGCDAGQARKLLPAACPQGAAVSYRQADPPVYPIQAARAGIEGEVFLVLQIGPDGHVVRAAPWQVDLYVRPNNPARGRQWLAQAAEDAAMQWRFNVPTQGPKASAGKWIVTVPLDFTLDRHNAMADLTGTQPQPPLWRAYFPGPINSIPWDAAPVSGKPAGHDAVAGGSLFMRDSRFVLLTPPGGLPTPSEGVGRG